MKVESGLKIQSILNVTIDMTIDLNLTIENIVQNKELSYMDAVLYHAQALELEPEAMAKMLNQSIKDKIEVEAQSLNMLKKTSKLPL